MRVLCVTPNPSIDRTLHVPGFAAGGVWRATAVSAVCGGKGLNVARAVRALGEHVLCAGLLRGHAGERAATLAAAEGLEGLWTWTRASEGETRTCVIIVGGAEATVINEPGAAVAGSDWSLFVADISEAARGADVVAISGSLPPGVPPSGLSDLIAAAGQGGRPVWLDTSGPALAEAVAAPLAGIKINGEEAQALVGQPARDVVAATHAARTIRARGPDNVAITLGSDGAVLAAAEGCWLARPPAIDAVSPVGSGDAFLAGLVVGLRRTGLHAEALRLATAAGAANALQSSARVDPADVGPLLEACTLDQIHPD